MKLGRLESDDDMIKVVTEDSVPRFLLNTSDVLKERIGEKHVDTQVCVNHKVHGFLRSPSHNVVADAYLMHK